MAKKSNASREHDRATNGHERAGRAMVGNGPRIGNHEKGEQQQRARSADGQDCPPLAQAWDPQCERPDIKAREAN